MIHLPYLVCLLLGLAWAVIGFPVIGPRECDDEIAITEGAWPDVVAVVPARDEASVIAKTLSSLLAQDYAAGRFRIVLVDDESRDGTAGIAAELRGAHPLTIVAAGARPPGWTGKLWAVSRGIAMANEPTWLWLTDADIAHTPGTLRALVTRAMRDRLVLNSRMALLRTDSLAERAIVPAFVWFFRLLYPFAAVNNARLPIAAAAGGCILIDGAALARAGGIAAIRGALIDDVAMGRLMKAQGPIRLALTRASRSLRAYGWAELWAMITRSAYAQLRYSPVLLVVALAGLSLLFGGPLALLIVLGGRAESWIAPMFMLSWYLGAVRFYRLSPFWALALPLVALFYMAATLASAIQHWRGRGGMWKGRAQAMRAS